MRDVYLYEDCDVLNMRFSNIQIDIFADSAF